MYCFEMCFYSSPLPPCLSPLFHPSPFSSFPSLPPPPVVVEEEEEEIFVSSSQIDRKRFFLISVLLPSTSPFPYYNSWESTAGTANPEKYFFFKKDWLSWIVGSFQTKEQYFCGWDLAFPHNNSCVFPLLSLVGRPNDSLFPFSVASQEV